jgi:hypothetical protein
MKFIQDTQPFEVLKQYFMPAIYHRIIERKKKLFQLSVSMEGTEVIIKKSAKPFVHTGFNKVITGAVMRMEQLFTPEHLQLEVIIYNTPNLQTQKISFELINKKEFNIGTEAYIVSIMATYDYAKMQIVTYYPIFYRQVCSNGFMAVMSSNFTETIDANTIFDIGCEWSRCSFEKYQRKLQDYFEILKNQEELSLVEDYSKLQQLIIKKIERVLRINLSNNIKETIFVDRYDSQNIEQIITDNLFHLGHNEFALWNIITDYASLENNTEKRNQMFINAGKYLSNEMKKTLNKNKTVWAENLVWDDVLLIAKK